jgi:methyl-accepting chemotaxis protein
MNNHQLKRRRIFINKTFQGRFILGAFAVILLSGLCSALLIYAITGGDLQAQSLSAHANIVNAGERLGMSIMIGNLVSILVAGAVAVVSVLYASHKIAGPLYRFETLCKEIGNGNLDGVTRLRDKDQLQELAEAFADMAGKLRSQRQQRSVVVATLARQLGQLQALTGLTAEQQQAISTLENTLKQLDS